MDSKNSQNPNGFMFQKGDRVAVKNAVDAGTCYVTGTVQTTMHKTDNEASVVWDDGYNNGPWAANRLVLLKR